MTQRATEEAQRTTEETQRRHRGPQRRHRGPQRRHRENAVSCHPLTACADAGGKSVGDWTERLVLGKVRHGVTACMGPR